MAEGSEGIQIPVSRPETTTTSTPVPDKSNGGGWYHDGPKTTYQGQISDYNKETSQAATAAVLNRQVAEAKALTYETNNLSTSQDQEAANNLLNEALTKAHTVPDNENQALLTQTSNEHVINTQHAEKVKELQKQIAQAAADKRVQDTTGQRELGNLQHLQSGAVIGPENPDLNDPRQLDRLTQGTNKRVKPVESDLMKGMRQMANKIKDFFTGGKMQ